jgi:hypothetical protein
LTSSLSADVGLGTLGVILRALCCCSEDAGLTIPETLLAIAGEVIRLPSRFFVS